MTEVLVRSMVLRCPVEHAFRVFTEKVDLWWPRGHRRFADGTLRLTDAALVDRSPAGEVWTMAEVVESTPPRRLVLDWFPGSPAAPTRVEVGFAAVPEGTEISIAHRALTAGAMASWPGRAAQFAGGWEAVLAALFIRIEEDEP